MPDDDDWIQSLAEAQAVTADTSEERLTHKQSVLDRKKVRPIEMREFVQTAPGVVVLLDPDLNMCTVTCFRTS